ncbi:MAG: nucleotidyltransferase domain-containing protein [Nanoarchaeota archaeon]|nr:nucleotidyltransferase domain-containing protein [Nanoarchaeota archaeon]MBU1005062.1 nucleotidyltransferase domain-containing protein [Nanoarchaeota archaeon]MBU1946276.1 nucleotidyltransferase domain-containing protein [Nanoarchaeota archaeon]
MLNKNETKILEKLVEKISLDLTLSDLSKELKQKYPQTHKSIQNLEKTGIIKIKDIGKSRIVKLDFSKNHPEYSIAEIERLNQAVKNKEIQIVLNKILNINKQFVCILFGSYASSTFKKDSDIDLLFIIPEEYDEDKFEKITKNSLSANNADINIIKEGSLFEMWAAPDKLNVGNELLKSHIVLAGAEYFMNLVRKKYVGR